MLDKIITPDVFLAAKTLREVNSFDRDDGTPLSFDADEKFLPIYQFADEKNKKITHLDGFAEKFLAKCTLGQMISRYMVLVSVEQKLLMMRPYQIYAVKAIVDCIHQGTGNGYIWHTTGSGKTLTSFKASTLLKDNGAVANQLFRRTFRNSKFFKTHVHLGTLTF